MKDCSGGFVGVDVFFVLSGYLITGILVRDLVLSNSVRYAEFYSRRARRLLPACVVMVAVVSIVAARVFSPIEQEGVYRSALATVMYVSNAYFAHSAQDYFAPQSASNPFLHTWSLAVEEQFYVLWPLFLALLFKLFRSLNVIKWAIGTVSILSLAFCVIFTDRNQPWAFFLMPMRAWEFGAGALISVGCADCQLSPRWARVVGWGGLGAILLSATYFNDRTVFPGATALAPVLGTVAILIAGGTAHRFGVGALLALTPLQFVGNLSYSIYLWHWPIIVLARELTSSLSVQGRVLCLVLTLALSYITYTTIEHPTRSNGYLGTRPAVSLGFALVVTALSVTGCLSWQRWIVHQEQYVRFKAVEADIPGLFEKGCDVHFTDHKPKVCVFGDPRASTSVVLFGDSHAAQWFPAVSVIADQEDWRVITLIKSSCPSADLAVFRRSPEWELECSKWRTEAIRLITNLEPNAILLGNYSGYGTPDNPSTLPSYDDWLAGYRNTLAKLQKTRARILLLNDTPMLPFDSVRCLARVAWDGTGSCPTPDRLTSVNVAASRAARTAARRYSDSYVIDLNNVICGPVYCPLSIAGQPVYRDMNHLTGAFVKALAPDLASRIVPIISKSKVGIFSTTDGVVSAELPRAENSISTRTF